LEFLSYRIAIYYNRDRLSAPTFKEGDKVYLLNRNIKTKRPVKKLDHLKLGPFEITEVIGKLNYRLKLPEKTRIYPVFHVSLLEKVPLGTRQQTHTNIEPEEDEYKVEQIIRYNPISNRYLVK
jgi:hypothetical protein